MNTAAEALVERRHAERMELQIRCFLICEGGQVTGVTRNLSRTGILVQCRQSAAFAKRRHPGECLKAYLEMPAEDRDPQRALYCQCSVVRTAVLDSGDAMLALAVLHMQFRDISDRFKADNHTSEETLES